MVLERFGLDGKVAVVTGAAGGRTGQSADDMGVRNPVLAVVE